MPADGELHYREGERVRGKDPDEIRRFLARASGRVVVEWQHEGMGWQATLAHTHGDVVALAIWCEEAGFVAYHEELAPDLLRRLAIVPHEPLWTRLRRALRRLRARFPG
ncbi:MAG: hypothetical protein HY321_22390 [Armatimonadetes bacterium]|nr:hypothetical protein [Armatimonadota bacterium]